MGRRLRRAVFRSRLGAAVISQRVLLFRSVSRDAKSYPQLLLVFIPIRVTFLAHLGLWNDFAFVEEMWLVS
jgi:hypothetical protein